MTSDGRKKIEELRDKVKQLKNDAQFLYRYGSLTSSAILFNNLSQNDKLRLIYIALLEGDNEVKDVACYLMKKLHFSPKNIDELLEQLSPDDKIELESLKKSSVPKEDQIKDVDLQRIDNELKNACDRIGYLEVEEAFWILIPNIPDDDSIWIEAVGVKNKDFSRFRLQTQVLYNPSDEELYDLLPMMQDAKWILHVHNHPESYGYITLCEPSDEDLNFASYWKSIRPELGEKMRFFVIKENKYVEY